MRDFVRPAGPVRALLLVLAASATLPAGAGLERTLFKDLPATDPAREIVRTVLSSPFYSMREGFTGNSWAADGFRDAWERARTYFPARTWLVVPGTHFMAHGFDPQGNLFMEVHESAFLSLCVGNRRTFTPGSVVAAYARMRDAADGREAAAFREKTGRLEPFFRGEDAHRALRKALGEDRYDGFLRALREEDYHMLAGGLMHEGVHAGLDDVLVDRIQSEFKAGGRSVQWDEMRAFMAEIVYHGIYGEWAAADLGAGRIRTARLLSKLESLRKRPSLHPGPNRDAFEGLRAGIGIEIALGRLRMREIWQSARRAEGLLASLRQDYIRGRAPEEFEGPLAAFERDSARYAAAAGEAIGAYELALRDLETLLDQWDEWADGARPFPPPVTDSNAAASRAAAVGWPDPPVEGARALMSLAGRALERERSLS
jgi:hypothetical protein